MKNNEKIKCFKLVFTDESDYCEKCGKQFCSEYLTYYGELIFCGKCK